MSDTPRTDELQAKHRIEQMNPAVQDLLFLGRTLERENAELKAEVERLKGEAERLEQEVSDLEYECRQYAEDE